MSAAVFRFRNILVLFDVGALVDYECLLDDVLVRIEPRHFSNKHVLT